MERTLSCTRSSVFLTSSRGWSLSSLIFLEVLKLDLRVRFIWTIFDYMTSAHPAISPKSQFYKSDGTGRDIYIAHNNGGLSASNLPVPELLVSSFRPKRFVSTPATSVSLKTVRYSSNGTGRDSYIARGSGGFEATSGIYSPKATFYLSLRSPAQRPATADSSLPRMWLPMASRLKLGTIAQRQKQLTQRLYTPKRG